MLHTIENQMFVRALGEECDGDAVLYVHGLGESGLCFERLVQHRGLAGFRQLVPDLPGYGRSAWPEEPLGLADFSDHLAGWLEDRGEPRVSVVGHSMGGVLGVLFAERHPGLVARLVNVDGNVSLDDCVYSGQAGAMEVDDFCARGFDAMREAMYRAGLEDAASQGCYVSLRLCDPRAYHLNSCELLSASRAEDMAERQARLDVSTLYVAGAPNGASPRSRELLESAGVPTVEIAPAGHWPFIDQPDAFVEAMAAFLER